MKGALMQYLAIGIAGAFGAMTRYFVTSLCSRWFGTAFPWGTLVINTTGSLFLGWFFTVVQDRTPVPDMFRLAIAVGFVGAYTTFSTFAFESNSLVAEGSAVKAVCNMGGSLLLGLIAVRLGILLASR